MCVRFLEMEIDVKDSLDNVIVVDIFSEVVDKDFDIKYGVFV